MEHFVELEKGSLQLSPSPCRHNIKQRTSPRKTATKPRTWTKTARPKTSWGTWPDIVGMMLRFSGYRLVHGPCGGKWYDKQVLRGWI